MRIVKLTIGFLFSSILSYSSFADEALVDRAVQLEREAGFVSRGVLDSDRDGMTDDVDPDPAALNGATRVTLVLDKQQLRALVPVLNRAQPQEVMRELRRLVKKSVGFRVIEKERQARAELGFGQRDLWQTPFGPYPSFDVCKSTPCALQAVTLFPLLYQDLFQEEAAANLSLHVPMLQEEEAQIPVWESYEYVKGGVIDPVGFDTQRANQFIERAAIENNMLRRELAARGEYQPFEVGAVLVIHQFMMADQNGLRAQRLVIGESKSGGLGSAQGTHFVFEDGTLVYNSQERVSFEEARLDRFLPLDRTHPSSAYTLNGSKPTTYPFAQPRMVVAASLFYDMVEVLKEGGVIDYAVELAFLDSRVEKEEDVELVRMFRARLEAAIEKLSQKNYFPHELERARELSSKLAAYGYASDEEEAREELQRHIDADRSRLREVVGGVTLDFIDRVVDDFDAVYYQAGEVVTIVNRLLRPSNKPPARPGHRKTTYPREDTDKLQQFERDVRKLRSTCASIDPTLKPQEGSSCWGFLFSRTKLALLSLQDHGGPLPRSFQDRLKGIGDWVTEYRRYDDNYRDITPGIVNMALTVYRTGEGARPWIDRPRSVRFFVTEQSRDGEESKLWYLPRDRIYVAPTLESRLQLTAPQRAYLDQYTAIAIEPWLDQEVVVASEQYDSSWPATAEAPVDGESEANDNKDKLVVVFSYSRVGLPKEMFRVELGGRFQLTPLDRETDIGVDLQAFRADVEPAVRRVIRELEDLRDAEFFSSFNWLYGLAIPTFVSRTARIERNAAQSGNQRDIEEYFRTQRLLNERHDIPICNRYGELLPRLKRLQREFRAALERTPEVQQARREYGAAFDVTLDLPSAPESLESRCEQLSAEGKLAPK